MKTKVVEGKITTQEIVELCYQVKKDIKDPYAKVYIDALSLCGSDYEVAVQVLYILSNLNYWRGDKARETKAQLKAYCKQQGVMR